MTGPEEQQERARWSYGRMMNIIAMNTGHPQEPLAAARGLWTTAVSHGPLSQEDASKAVRAAVENDDVIKWVDGEGKVRYGLTDSGQDRAELETSVYGEKDVEALRECISVEASRESPNQEFIAWANAQIAECD